MHAPPLGQTLLEDLAGSMAQDDILRYMEDYGALTGYDVAFRQLLASAGGQVDLARADHRAAVVNWLRAWGCRHLRRAGTDEAAAALDRWWAAWGDALPAADVAITHLDEQQLRIVERAFEELRAARVPGRGPGERRFEVVVGDTAAAKVFFVVRPLAFLPWDDATRLAFGWWGGGLAYADLLRLSARALHRLANRLGVEDADVPAALGRPVSTPPKLVDEFLWMRISREV